MAKPLPCSTCGELRYPIKAGVPVAACNACRRSRPGYRVRKAKPVETWQCAKCATSCSRPATRGQRPRYCEKCQARDWISRTRRFAIYERDGWTCWLCEELVDRSLVGTRSEWRPSLDHVITRSTGGSDRDENLRLAHWWCNCVRSNDKYAPEAFRVGV